MIGIAGHRGTASHRGIKRHPPAVKPLVLLLTAPVVGLASM